MSKDLYELRDMLMDELDNITSKGELTAGSLDTVDKLTHSIKSIDTICAMEETKDYSYNDGNSYARSYNDGNSYARGRGSNAKRDNRGRYSRRGYSRTYGGYSGDNKEELVDNLRELMDTATDEKSRMAIHKAIKQLEE